MNIFQWIVLPCLAVIVVLDVRGLAQRRGNVVPRVIRILAWCAAFLLIVNPPLTSKISQFVGIGRGTDLVVYVFMLVAPVVWFRIQTQTHSLQRQIIRLARIEATRNAVAGSGLASRFDSHGGSTNETERASTT
ncbi:DUF2304 domain-containing protein [Rubripirellula amarantea]|nr:DUF2304 domain-containing protein [Rubripirellula amarantea]